MEIGEGFSIIVAAAAQVLVLASGLIAPIARSPAGRDNRGMTETAPPQTFRTTRRVEFSDTDAAGIAHFTAFFRYMEQAEHELLRSVGLSVFMPVDGEEITWPRVSSKCDFRSMAKFEEVLEIAASISRLGEKSVTWSFRFTIDTRDVASGEITTVCCRVNADGTLTSTPIPPLFLTKLRPFLTPDP